MIDLHDTAGTFAVASFLFAVATAFVTWLIRLPWWLKSQFISLKDDLESLLDRHEVKDQHRHEDNIQRFTKIETLLNLSNGHKEEISKSGT